MAGPSIGTDEDGACVWIMCGRHGGRVLQRSQKKLYLSEVVNRGDDQNQQQESMTASEVLSMVKFGAAAIFDSKNQAEPSDADLDAIVDRSRTETTSVGNLKGEQTHNASDFDATTERSTRGIYLG